MVSVLDRMDNSGDSPRVVDFERLFGNVGVRLKLNDPISVAVAEIIDECFLAGTSGTNEAYDGHSVD